jgi:hypothetical protein
VHPGIAPAHWRGTCAYYGDAVYEDASSTAIAATPMLPAEWLDETLNRARALLPRDDPFVQALERQREPLPDGWRGLAPELEGGVRAPAAR